MKVLESKDTYLRKHRWDIWDRKWNCLKAMNNCCIMKGIDMQSSAK